MEVYKLVKVTTFDVSIGDGVKKSLRKDQGYLLQSTFRKERDFRTITSVYSTIDDLVSNINEDSINLNQNDKITTLDVPELTIFGGHAVLYSPVSGDEIIGFFSKYVDRKRE
ncbi:hypothetical protein HYT23_02930 [Candidatus Pacearchaeota archaeon]|nr:hypothetical protein [Candidatus Pacearchaeota archaeon]